MHSITLNSILCEDPQAENSPKLRSWAVLPLRLGPVPQGSAAPGPETQSLQRWKRRKGHWLRPPGCWQGCGSLMVPRCRLTHRPTQSGKLHHWCSESGLGQGRWGGSQTPHRRDWEYEMSATCGIRDQTTGQIIIDWNNKFKGGHYNWIVQCNTMLFELSHLPQRTRKGGPLHWWWGSCRCLLQTETDRRHLTNHCAILSFKKRPSQSTHWLCFTLFSSEYPP